MNDPGEDNPFHHLNLSLDLHVYFSSIRAPTEFPRIFLLNSSSY